MSGEILLGFFVIILFIFFYFIPTMVAMKRNIKNILGVFFLNFFLGWTGLGWIGALIWSVVEEPVNKSRR